MTALRTEILLPKAEKQIDTKHNILTIGSCFAENIGNKFSYYKFNSQVNPFGVLYNPMSIAQNIGKTIDCKQFSEKDLVCQNEVWNSFFHHSKYANTDKTELLQTINNLTIKTKEFLCKANFILITFGTSWVYKLTKNYEVVANCHKLPADNFTRYRLSVNDVVATYTDLIEKIKKLNQNIEFIFTVSPIRHWKDGAVENQQSKAILLLAVSEITKNFESAHYFPSYEIIMDDLRDYRFYADDMLHPSELAVNYIWQKFKDTWINTETHKFMNRVDKLNKAVNHRPFMPNTDTYQTFLKNQLQKLQQIQKEYPYLNFLNEISHINKQLLS